MADSVTQQRLTEQEGTERGIFGVGGGNYSGHAMSGQASDRKAKLAAIIGELKVQEFKPMPWIEQKTACSKKRDTLELLPASEQTDNEELWEALIQQLRDEVEVGNEGRLQDDGHVGGVEQLDGVVHTLASVSLAANRQVHTEALHTLA
jgi:hypothetical protein